MTTLLAIDPGARHCGWALFYDGSLADAGELSPDDMLTRARHRGASELVVEEFRLYPHTSCSLAYDPLKTVEVIGALRLIAQWRGAEFITQPAAIKRPAGAMVRRRGLPTLRRGGHARDAQLHGYYRLLSTGRIK